MIRKKQDGCRYGGRLVGSCKEIKRNNFCPGIGTGWTFSEPDVPRSSKILILTGSSGPSPGRWRPRSWTPSAKSGRSSSWRLKESSWSPIPGAWWKAAGQQRLGSLGNSLGNQSGNFWQRWVLMGFSWVFRSSIEGDILCSTFTEGTKT